MIEIESIGLEDADELAEVAVRAYKDHYLHLWHDGGDWYLKRSFDVEVLRDEIAGESNRFYFAVLDGERVGFLKTRHDRSPAEFAGRKAFEVERIYLTRAAQGKGVGRALMEFSVERARELGSEVVWLKAMDTSDDAIAFYRKCGFEICGRERLDYAEMKEELRGMVVMKREI